MALGPGFEIRNDTDFPLQISLDQVGPLYFEVVQPGKTFVRDTGAVWFTIRASTCLDPDKQLTTWDAVWPIGAFTAKVLVGAVMIAVTAGAAGPAIAAAGSAASAGATTGLSGAAAAGVSALAPALVGLGVPAGKALVVAGFTVGGTIAAGKAGGKAIADAFSQENTAVKRPGSYAGPPWPFREERKKYRVIGGPNFTKKGDVVHLNASPLRIV